VHDWHTVPVTVMRFNSIQVRLLVGLALVSVLAFVASGVLLYVQISSHLFGQFDHALSDKARIIEAGCELMPGELTVRLDGEYLNRIHDPTDPEFILLQNLDSKEVILKSASFDERDLSPPDSVDGDHKFVNLESSEGERIRFLVRNFSIGPEHESEEVRLTVGHQLFRIEDNQTTIRKVLLQIGCSILLTQLLAIWVVLRLNLSPLLSLSRQIDSARPNENRPFEAAGAPTEIAGVIERLNLLMNRVEETIQNERRFSSIAAHELRTPLAGIRSIAEREISNDGMRKILAIESRMERLVENLLIVSRVELSEREVVTERVDPERLLVKGWAPFFDAAEEKNIMFRIGSGCASGELNLPVPLLTIVLRNLLDNALEYTRPGGTIQAGAKILEGHQIEFFVENQPTSDLMSSPTANHLTSGSVSRADQGSGAPDRHMGLGLLICRRIARLLDANFIFDRIPPDRVRAGIVLSFSREE
jgi:signal transduction histidine kinase